MTAPAPLAQTEGPWGRTYRVITVAIVGLVTITAFEAMAVTTAMPRAASDLGEIGSYGLAFSLMLTAQLVGIVVAGPWSDSAGPMPPLLAGQVLFTIGSAVCGCATSWPMLLIGRVVTGLGAGLAVVVVYVVIGHVYPDRIRAKVMVALSAAWVLPSMVGAPLAGIVTATLTWRLVFGAVVVPAIAILVALRAQQHRIDAATPPSGTERSLDAGARSERALHRRAATYGVGLALGAGLLQWGTHEPAALLSLPSALAAAGLIAVAVLAPRMLPAGTLRLRRGMPAAVVARFLLNATFNGAITYVPAYLSLERGVPLGVAGLLIAVGSLGWSAGAWVQGRDAVQRNRPGVVMTGSSFLLVAMLLLGLCAVVGAPPWLVGASLAVAGLGMGLGSTILSVIVLALSPEHERGAASSSLQLADVLGSVLGIAACSAWFVSAHVAGGHDGHTYAVMWLGLALLPALGVVAGLRSRPAAGSASG